MAENLVEQNRSCYLYLPTIPEELATSCLEKKYLVPLVRFCPGIWMTEAPNHLKGYVDAEYGLEMIDPKTAETIATCGFDLSGKQMEITHTPQGRHPLHLSSEVRNRLVRTPFRLEMLQHLLEVARALNLDSVEGQAATSHPKVISGRMSLEEGRKRMDDLYQSLGFQLVEMSYHLDLRSY